MACEVVRLGIAKNGRSVSRSNAVFNVGLSDIF